MSWLPPGFAICPRKYKPLFCSLHFFTIQATMTTSPPPPVLVRTVELPSSDHIAVIVSLNRPEKKNCFDIKVVQNLASTFRDINREVREQQLQQSDDGGEGRIAAVILTGEGSSFCAGADLSNPPSPLDASSDLPHHLHNNPVHQMSLCRVPSECFRFSLASSSSLAYTIVTNTYISCIF